jgi:hypothetical protein
MDRVRAREQAQGETSSPTPSSRSSSSRGERSARADAFVSPEPTFAPTMGLPAAARSAEPLASPLARAMGGSPLGVAARLVFLSFLIGAALHWLDIRPSDLIWRAEELARRVWAYGFDGLREALGFILTGAMIVAPLWLLSRLLGGRRA